MKDKKNFDGDSVHIGVDYEDLAIPDIVVGGGEEEEASGTDVEQEDDSSEDGDIVADYENLAVPEISVRKKASDGKTVSPGAPKRKPLPYRVGTGYDVHRLAEGRKLVLGGVEIPFEKGLLGHSDSDVLLHAVMDAMLGAASLGDIGLHFPDTDDAWRDISSLELLRRTRNLVREAGFEVGNIDATVIAQKPKLRPYIGEMSDNMAEILEIPAEDCHVKATTEEGLGFTGRGEGIAASAVCLLIRRRTAFS